MVYVRLQESWTDRDGNRHPAGETVDVDAATLAELQAGGVAADPGGGDDSDSWAGPTGGGEETDSWAGPTGGGEETDSWAGPTGGGEETDSWAGPTGGGSVS